MFDYSFGGDPISITPTFSVNTNFDMVVWRAGLSMVVCNGHVSLDGRVPCEQWKLGYENTAQLGSVPLGVHTQYKDGWAWIVATEGAIAGTSEINPTNSLSKAEKSKVLSTEHNCNAKLYFKRVQNQ